jgi:L-rhamnose mutarotase
MPVGVSKCKSWVESAKKGDYGMRASGDKQVGRRALIAGAATLVAGTAGSASGSTNPTRVCFLLQVKKDRLKEYKERHKSVWPEMLRALRETGWHNYSLFLRDDGLLIGYVETPDFDKARAGMAARQVNKRWQDQMAGFFEIPKGVHADEQMRPLPEVFHLD